ncbi:hypothetical protein [Streptomyces sp. UG1]|uniref:hypothetical protein n=1 Tax=Streptomyces sp. UG1 TaxID=3417652 RepID=UPI003CF05FCF
MSVPAMAAGGLCAVVLGLRAEQALRIARDGTQMRSGLLYVASALGEGVTAALLRGRPRGRRGHRDPAGGGRPYHLALRLTYGGIRADG